MVKVLQNAGFEWHTGRGRSSWDRSRPSTARQGRAQCRTSRSQDLGDHPATGVMRAAAGDVLDPLEAYSATQLCYALLLWGVAAVFPIIGMCAGAAANRANTRSALANAVRARSGRRALDAAADLTAGINRCRWSGVQMYPC
jgi:hypothetical protein